MTPPTYTEQFKAQAVRMVQDHRPDPTVASPALSVARLLGLEADLLLAWVAASVTPAPSPARQQGGWDDDLRDVTDVQDFLERLTGVVTDGLRATDPYVRCTIMAFDGGVGRTLAASTDSARDIDAVQFDTGEGPSLLAGRTQSLVLVGDVTTEGRWSSFAWTAARHGVVSMIGVPFLVSGVGPAALSAYAPQAHAFSSDAIQQVRERTDRASRLLRSTAPRSS
ncbi:GAF domain-containing protein [Tersicoccus sp. Bi-70]|uniref:GAF domain-containing protein n=1 Tax=Tersicoccus sp. Bi-70 TaxID=1897634 RepID=UPI000978055C|nr:GAF domain-containing protein [Tersicoccus sp. Bi-70]OMH34857.1 hypothetical protein BGP79_00315 [Tersicoccus sp. Bi-70]